MTAESPTKMDHPDEKYPGKLTFRVIITCVMAASGGLIFGYDHGVSGNLFPSSILVFTM